MGRKGSKLIPFLKEALNEKKYSNLQYGDISRKTFILHLPQKTTRLNEDCQIMLQDWYQVKGRQYNLTADYTEAKQGMEAALRKSDFLKRLKNAKKNFVYRFLTPSEVADKKRILKEQKKAKKLRKAMKANPYSNSECVPSPESSGYSSGSENELCEMNGSPTTPPGWNDQEHMLKLEKGSIEEIWQHGYVENFNGVLCLLDGTKVFFRDGYILKVEEIPGNGSVQLQPVEDVHMVNDQASMVQSVEDFNMVTDETLMGQSDMITDQTPIRNDGFVSNTEEILLSESMKQASESPPVGNQSFNSALLLHQLESIASAFPNLCGDNKSTLPEAGILPLQDPVVDCMSLNPTLNACNDNDKLVEEMLDFFINSENHSGGEIQPTASTPAKLDIISYKTKVVKIYECFNWQDLPGLIVLICQPKLKEFCVTVATKSQPSNNEIIFDEETRELISKNTIENLQFLSNGHLLVTLQCKEPIY